MKFNFLWLSIKILFFSSDLSRFDQVGDAKNGKDPIKLNRMHSKFFAALFALLSLAISTPVKSQEIEGCFMIDGNGRYISLTSLCPQPALLLPEEGGQLTELAIPALARFHAEKYCGHRRTSGKDRQESLEYAANETVEFMTTKYGFDQTKSFIETYGNQLFLQEQNEVQKQCSDLA